MRRRRNNGDNGFEAWGGYMEAKKSKLLDQFKQEAGKESNGKTDKIFLGISVFVNGYTTPSADEIKRIMMTYGGTYHHYYSTEKTKFIIATNLADAKIKQLRGQPKIVKPNWILDCLSAGTLLDYRSYLLYSNHSTTQPKISFPTTASFDDVSAKQKTQENKFLKLDIECTKILSSKLSSHTLNTKEITHSVYTDSSTSRESIENWVSSPSTVSNCMSTEKVETLEPSYNLNYQKNTEVLNQNVMNSPEKSLNFLNIAAKHSRGKSSTNSLTESINLENTVTSVKTFERTEQSIHQCIAKTKCTNIPKAGEANFLTEFYNHSRLHHISTMGSMFKKYVSNLRKYHNGTYPGREELLEWRLQQPEHNSEIEWQIPADQKVIMHIDMDCFFVSVGLRKHPELRGFPVAVTHGKGNVQTSRIESSRDAEIECYRKRMENKFNKYTSNEIAAPLREWMTDVADESSSMSEIASCSYEARKVGIKNGMFLGAALKKCPNLKTIPYDFEGYKEVSFTLYHSVSSFTLNIEAVSCDEMFVDCTDVLKETNTSPLQFATFLRNKIKMKTGCPASTGFGANILLARLATRKAKPDGQFHLLPENVQNFMQDIKVDDLPGVGRNLSFRLESMHIKTCKDLQGRSIGQLQSEFGQKTGLALYQHCRGQDDRNLDLDHQRKSVSAEVNYGIRFEKPEEVSAFIRELAHEVHNRLQDIGCKGRCVTLKLMVKAKDAPTKPAKFMGHGVCDSISRSSTLTTETDDPSVIARETIKLLEQLVVPPSHLRGMGIQLTKLTEKSSAEGNLNNFIVRGKTSKADFCNANQETTTTGKTKVIQSTDENLIDGLDPDFLAALPEDIRAEVISEHKHMKLLQQPRETRSTNSRSNSFKSQQSLLEISYSQIDSSFLDALPDDVREELKNDLQESMARTRSKEATDLQYPTKKNSSSSPKKGKNSPNSKIKLLPKGQQKIDEIMKSPAKESIQKETVQQKEVHSCSRSLDDISDTESFGVLNIKMPNEELLALIREWVDSVRVPQAVDRDIMGDFLHHLVKVRRIDKVSAVLRTLHRKIDSKQSNSWQDIYEQIVMKVQENMMQYYGAKLQVIEEF